MGKGILLAVGLSACLSLQAQRFGAWGEAIYWKPDFGDVSYVAQRIGQDINSSDGINGEARARLICPHYSWGFRFGGEWLCQCLSVQLAGSYLHSNDSSRAQGLLYPLLPLNTAGGFNGRQELLGNTAADLKLEYWDLTLRFGCTLFQYCCADFHFFGGVRYADVEQRLSARIDGFELRNSSQQFYRQRGVQAFSGTGPEVGFGGSVQLWRCFNASAECGVSALIGVPKAFWRSRVSDSSPFQVNQVFRPDHCVGVFPGLATRLAVGVTWGWAQCAVGYDLVRYWGVLSVPGVAGGGVPEQFNIFPQDVGLGGPSIKVGISW